MPYNDERLPPSGSAVIRWFSLDNFEPERAVTSYWVSSKVFLAIRIPLVLYSTVIMWTSIATSAIEGSMRSYFIYFTHLTYIGLHAYLVVNTITNKHALQKLMTPSTHINVYFYLTFALVRADCRLSPCLLLAAQGSPLIF